MKYDEKKNKRFHGKFEKITGTSIVVLSIQFKPFEVFGATRNTDYNEANIIYCREYTHS